MKRIYFALALASFGALSHATVLTFSDLGVSNLQGINNSYGDNVQSTNDGVGSYLMGNGWTPNVTTSYESTLGSQTLSQLVFWGTNYSGLNGIACSAYGSGRASVTLTADAGYHVRLNSFDLGAYSNTILTASLLKITDGEGNVLLDQSGSMIGQVNPVAPTHFAPDFVAQQLTIEWGMDWDIGIDNLDFDQEAVPEPTVLGLAAIALVGLKRRRK